MRIVLTTFGTLGDVHPLIAIALEMRQRGHTPVLAVPEIFRAKIEPLGLGFFKVGPTLNPEDPQQVAELMDIRKGTERTLREVLFPAIRQSYDELRAAVEAGGGADLMLAGELTYQAPIVAEVTGVRWASYVLAPLSFFLLLRSSGFAAISGAGAPAKRSAGCRIRSHALCSLAHTRLGGPGVSVARGAGSKSRRRRCLRC